jgi:hypothetical protein
MVLDGLDAVTGESGRADARATNINREVDAHEVNYTVFRSLTPAPGSCSGEAESGER